MAVRGVLRPSVTWNTLDRIATIAVILAAVTLVWSQFRHERVQSPASRQNLVIEPVASGTVTTTTDTKKLIGSPRVAVVEFSDFQCPFCGRYALETYPQIERAYIATGKVEYVLRHFPLSSIHPLALRAAEAAECASRHGKYWEMRQLLFDKAVPLPETDLGKALRGLGIDESECLDTDVRAAIQADIAEGDRLGIQSTPTFLIGTIQPNGNSITVVQRIRGAQPFAAFESAIGHALRDRSN